jgi:hypothetical protein
MERCEYMRHIDWYGVDVLYLDSNLKRRIGRAAKCMREQIKYLKRLPNWNMTEDEKLGFINTNIHIFKVLHWKRIHELTFLKRAWQPNTKHR